jgi:hypothetical protein
MIILSNNETLSFIDNDTFLFEGNNQIFHLRYQEKKGFVICNEDIKMLSMNESYKDPDLKKYMITISSIQNVDNKNIFEINGLKIGHINTRYFFYFDKESKKNIYTKIPETTEYILVYKNTYNILTYCRNSRYSIHSFGPYTKV